MALTHLDENANPSMVNVGTKAITQRTATAQSIVFLGGEIMRFLVDGEILTPKGAVFQTAMIAGTMAAKKTADLIPLCHPLGLHGCNFNFQTTENEVIITCICSVEAKTGVEMEALTGASVAALTIYDMCKAMSHGIVIRDTRLLAKTGGKRDFSA